MKETKNISTKQALFPDEYARCSA